MPPLLSGLSDTSGTRSRARGWGAGGMTGFSAQTRAIIRDRAKFYCERCGERMGHEIHHRRPRGMGSTHRPETNQPSNGLLLCQPCHLFVESNRKRALEHGWLVRQHQDPIQVPVLYRGTKVWLDDNGNMHDNPREAIA